MTPLVCRVRSLQELRQCVADASGMFGRDVVVFVSSFPALVEGTWLRSSDPEGNNVGVGNVRACCEENGGEWFWEAAQCGDGLVGGRGQSVVVVEVVVVVVVVVIIIIRAMWKWILVSVSMGAKEREEADHWCSFIVDLIENWPSRGACSFLVRTGISSTKVTSNADHENTTDQIMERYVTDLCCRGNDVTVSCSSATLKHANAGRERQRTAVQKEALVDAAILQQKFRRSFFSMLIIESRVGQDRLYNPRIFSATFKEQVFDAQLLRLVEDYTATSSLPDVHEHRHLYLYRSLNDTSFQSSMVLSLIGWRSIWTLWHYCVLQLICSFSISVKEACSYNSWISQKSFFCKLSHCW